MIEALPELGDQLVLEIFVSDLERSLALYTALGFIFERRDGNFVALRWEGREFFLYQIPRGVKPIDVSRANVRILTSRVDEMWELVQRLGLRVEEPIDNRYYGLRDFRVLDPDGFGLRFAGPPSP